MPNSYVHALFRRHVQPGPTFADGGSSNAVEDVVRYTNCRLLRDGALRHEDLWVQGGRVVSPQELFWGGKRKRALADTVVDCKGMILSAGLIDLQLNGGWGFDFSEPAHLPHGLSRVASELIRCGVTSFLPTVITSSPEAYRAILPHLVPRAGSSEGASVLGVHLEGPFLAPSKPGCHPIEHLRTPDADHDVLRRACGDHISHLRLVTLAPELPDASRLIAELISLGVVVSAGHSNASQAEMAVALRAGVRMCTHLFNAMPPFHHREPGIIGILGSSEFRPFFGLIADGIHVHPASLKIAAKARPDGAVLVSDAMAALGLEEGTYNFAGAEVEVSEGRAVISGTDTLAGAAISLDECVRRFRRYCDVTSAAALEAASLHPAQVLGIEKTKGSLVVGADADFILLDDALQVQRTYIGGELVWQRQSETLEAS